MARSVLVDAGFLVAMLSHRDFHHQWAVQQASENLPPWRTCEAVLSETCYPLGERGAPELSAMLLRRAVAAEFSMDDNLEGVIELLRKYSSVPMSLADACLVRMSEKVADPVLLTTVPASASIAVITGR